MADFAAEVRRLMTERGMSLRRLAKAASYDSSYLSKVLSGHKPSSPYLAARLDDTLGAGGAIRDAAQQPLPRRAHKPSTPGRKPSGAVEALQVAMAGDPAGPDIGADGLAELVQHYAHTLAVAPSPAVYCELLSARSFAGTLLGRSARQLTQAGVPDSVIRIEDQSKDTWQNVELSLPYLREALAMGLRLAVVSKWYHLRTVYCLRHTSAGDREIPLMTG